MALAFWPSVSKKKTEKNKLKMLTQLLRILIPSSSIMWWVEGN